MNMRAKLGLGVSAIVLGATLVGGAIAGAKDIAAMEREAGRSAGRAAQLVAAGDARKAIAFAETAVSLAPQNASYRAMLGQAYLKSGRFTSAKQALADALSLAPQDGRVALNFALAQIAEGQWDQARETLAAHVGTIPVADRGLALALAGDPTGAVELLSTATRTLGAGVKTRQNLALALALAGRWPEARSIAALDLAPADVDARILQWATFARPVSAFDQVAALLGVVAIKDVGQPVALALAASVSVAVAAAPAEPTPEPVVETASVDVPVPAVEPSATPAPVIRFAERVEVVQALPVQAAAPAPARVAPVRVAPVRVAAVSRGAPLIASPGAFKTVAVRPVPAAARTPAKGNWYVQLGAFENAAVARDGWARAQRRSAAFAGHQPTGTAFASRAGAVYRLSVGGFARADADALCRGYRAKGGACFVRAGAGDAIASWIKPAGRVQMASR